MWPTESLLSASRLEIVSYLKLIYCPWRGVYLYVVVNSLLWLTRWCLGAGARCANLIKWQWSSSGASPWHHDRPPRPLTWALIDVSRPIMSVRVIITIVQGLFSKHQIITVVLLSGPSSDPRWAPVTGNGRGGILIIFWLFLFQLLLSCHYLAVVIFSGHQDSVASINFR